MDDFDPTTTEVTDATDAPELPGDPITPDAGVPEPPSTNGKPRSPHWQERFRLIKGDVREDRTKRDKTIPPKPREGSLQKQLEQFYGGIGLIIAPFDMVCGTAIINQAPECAKAMEEWARENPRVRALIMQASELGTVGKVVAAHLPIIAAIMAHHTPMGALNIQLGPQWQSPGEAEPTQP